MRALAIDLGGSHVTAALVDATRVLACRTHPLGAGTSMRQALETIAELLRGVLADGASRPADCAGIALGFCGIVDSRAGRVLSTNGKYDDAPGLDLAAWAAATFGLRLRAENDARLALLGERQAGAARGFADVVMMTFGTGVGGAALIGGRLLRGRHFQAGCLGGHFPVMYGGRTCSCGNVGCVEAEASTAALPALCRTSPRFAQSTLADAPSLDLKTAFEHADAGDELANEVVERVLDIWAVGAVALIHAYDPEVLVLGGAAMGRADRILPHVRRHVEAHAWTPWGRVEIRPAQLSTAAALLGAVPLLMEEIAG